MSDLLVGLALVLVIEGLLWALVPNFGLKLLEAARSSSESALRTGGVIAVAVGVLLVWLIRG